jgi:hypothetical protein
MSGSARNSKADHWSTKLARPIEVRNGPTLNTLADAWAFMVLLPEGAQLRAARQRAAERVLTAGDGAGDVAAATRQIELALFLEARWLGTISISVLESVWASTLSRCASLYFYGCAKRERERELRETSTHSYVKWTFWAAIAAAVVGIVGVAVTVHSGD